MGHLDFLDLKVHLDRREQLEAPDQRETEVRLDLRGPRDHQESCLSFHLTFSSKETRQKLIGPREKFVETTARVNPDLRRMKMWT